MPKHSKILSAALLLFLSAAAFSCPAFAANLDDDFSKAVSLYEKGLYSSAMDLFQSLPGAGDDPVIDGYAVLCAQKMKASGYERLADAYLKEYPRGYLKDAITRERAYDLFDRKEFGQALEYFLAHRLRDVPKKETAAFLYKLSYCRYRAGQIPEAIEGFERVGGMQFGDYSAPSWYCIAYIKYNDGQFAQALEWFTKAAVDERLRQIANYYSVICHYQLREYELVIQTGTPLYEDHQVDPQRRHCLARMISESYLVKGDAKTAREYYSLAGDEGKQTRADLFYAGSLMFATEDYKSAIENYSSVCTTPDSLAQIALYNTALSYIKLKNKVAALEAFKGAAALDFDLKMTEDAFFNWAKLSFDINRDGSVFGKYLSRWSDKVRGEKIYSYIALAALSDRDWQEAINNFDKIENLSPKDENNYVHANYLRACQLLDNGSYRRAIPYFQTVDFLTPKDDRLNQLSRLYLAMALYSNGQWENAASTFVSLYNSSALIGMTQNRELAYNAAYAYMKKGDYDTAIKWFSTYISQGESDNLKDAMTRLADCHHVSGNYLDAATAYGNVHAKYPGADDIYPYYYQAVCLGLAKKGKLRLQTLKEVLNASSGAPLYSEALFELSKAYQENRNMDEAAKICRKLISTSPDSTWQARGLLELGTLKRNAGFADAALECYKKVVEEYSGSIYSEDALIAIESLYRKMKKPALYLAYLESIGRGGDKTPVQKQQMLFDAAEQIFYSEDYPLAVSSFKEFIQAYPDSVSMPTLNDRARYYIARSYENMGDKVQACDYYMDCVEGVSMSESFVQDAWTRYAALSYSMANYTDALKAYRTLAQAGSDVMAQRKGITLCQWQLKDFEATVGSCDTLLTLTADKEAPLRRSVSLIKARALVGLSRRDEALPILEALSREPLTEEGAQATVMLARHYFDAADFKTLATLVKDFAASGTDNEYCLACCFIILGDSFVEQGQLKQAKATFKSIADGYSGAKAGRGVSGMLPDFDEGTDISKELNDRLERLKEVEL